MKPHREIILQGLQDLSNVADSGRKCVVTFTANGYENWLQCTLTQLNMDWPFSSAPADNPWLQSCFGTAGAIQILGWEVDSFVTFTPALKDVNELVTAIDRTFRELYELDADYDLGYEVTEL